MSETHPTTSESARCGRRAFLASAASAVAAVASTTSAAGQTSEYDWADDGDYIERDDDLEALRRYMPYLSISPGSRSQLIGLYGWIGQSPDHDTDVYAYWARYSHQNAGIEELGVVDYAVGIFASDSHIWDHEPSYIFVDPQTGEVEKAVVTGYHHFPLEISGENAPLTQGYADFPTHLNLQVVDPWHHYMIDHGERGVDVTNFARFESFLEKRDSWRDTGFYDSSSNVAIDNPWAIEEGRVDSWWAEDSRDARAAKIWARLGVRGAGDVSAEVLPEGWW